MKKRVLSGMQPSGKLHLGNLVGALENWVALQDDYDTFYFVADWHALTTGYAKTETINGHVTDVLVNWLSAGLDPSRSTIFLQSHLPEHAELHLLLSMITPLGWLERVPTYKEKIEQVTDRDLHTYGFLGYPVLQSADILIYNAHHVPVGIDQLPHLEITREIARRFNHLYGTTFVEPEGLLTKFPKVPGIDGRKMSKTYDNCIYLSDDAETVDKKLRTMMTDPARKRRTDPGNPDICPVFDLHDIFSTEEERAYCTEGCTTAGIGCIDCKKILIAHVQERLDPVRERRREYLNRPDVLADIVKAGAEKARTAVRETMDKVRTAMGLRFP